MPTSPSTLTLIGRALRKRCPMCGRGRIFRSHFRMNRECPNCHVVFWKDPGESLGAMYFDYALAFGFFFLAWGALAWFTNVSEPVQLVILASVVVVSVVVFYPLSRSLWTLMIYLSGGIERPQMRTVRGGKPPSP